MKFLFPQALRNTRALACTLFGCIAGVVSLPTKADVFIPHLELTPYQLQSEDGSCFQVNASTHQMLFGTCNDDDPLQKFYVLNEASDTNLNPSPGENVSTRGRIVSAPDFDRMAAGSGGLYLLVARSSGIIYLDTQSTINADENHKWTFISTFLDRDSRGIIAVGSLARYANEGQSFFVSGRRDIIYDRVRYSYDPNKDLIPDVPLPVARKTLTGFGVTDPYPCTNTFFGGDPDPGQVKGCHVLAFPTKSTYGRFFVQVSDGSQCVSRDASSVAAMGGCKALKSAPYADNFPLGATYDYFGPAPATIFRLRPTSYPH